MNRISRLSLAYVFIIGSLLVGCQTTPEPPKPAKTYLVSSTAVNKFTKTELQAEVQQFNWLVTYGIEQYKLTYTTTTPEGQEVTASGAVIIPTQTTAPLSVASIQHGTIFDESDAPSYYKTGTESALGSILASNGIIVAMPDYLGYGASKQLPHPYEHAKGLAEPSIDFMRAVNEFLKSKNASLTNKWLLAGYSEGGYATMAMHKAIEEKYASEFKLAAVTAGAGAYNKSGMLQEFVANGSSTDPSHLRSYIWVMQTYNRLEGLNRPLNSIFKEPYAAEIAANGLPKTLVPINQMLQPALIEAIRSKSDVALLAAFQRNDVYDWKPTVPTRLLHGTADTYVPYFNTQSAYDAMTKRGATSVELVPLKGDTHGSGVLGFLTNTLEMFQRYR